MDIQFLGAAREVTGSCHMVRCGDHRLLVDCGQVQGAPADEARNRAPFPFDPAGIEAVVLTQELVHGEPKPMEALTQQLRFRRAPALMPTLGERIDLLAPRK